MFRREAEWIGAHLAALPVEAISPLVNIGSSTGDFRERIQPWIDEAIFKPLRERGVEVVHVDLKTDPGVDMIANILEDEGFERLRALKPQMALLCNVLEHVLDPATFTRRSLDILRPGGRLLVSVPRSYPHHNDPIDTMFRPTPEEVLALVPGAKMVHGEILATEYHWDEIKRNPKKLMRDKFKWLFTPYLVTFAELERG